MQQKRDYIKGFIELRYETGWRKPIQGYIVRKYHGIIKRHHFFAEWNTFDEAINWLKHGHGDMQMFIDTQIRIGLY